MATKKNSLGTTNTNTGRYHKPAKRKTPAIEYKRIMEDSGSPGYTNRLLVATPTLGNVRIEWVTARYGQIVPTNWSMVQMLQYMNQFVALRYQIADAQNLIVKEAIEKKFEWLLLIEDDTCPPPDAFIRFNEHIRHNTAPVISGLYYTKSEPSEPLLYRGRGNSFYDDWELGDKVWVDGVPTGMLLIRVKLLEEMWKDSPEYITANGGQKTRRVFHFPEEVWFDEKTDTFNTLVGTSDLDWCTRVIEGDYIAKAGYPKIAKKQYPLLCDTAIFAKHITPEGKVYPY